MNKASKAKIVFIVGFDRCGSSLAAKLLSKHPEINLLFQPFNRTEIQTTQWEIWSPDKRVPNTEAFVDGLLDGYLDKSYLSSDWFYKHSTSFEIDTSKVNLIKDTKFHFKIQWLKTRYPEIDFWGIWRDPRGIVCSLMRNDFYQKWYGENDFRVVKALIEKETLFEQYRRFLDHLLNDTEKMALLVAVRTHYMAVNLVSENWLVYEDILCDANRALAPFFKNCKLNGFDVSKHIREDANVIGQPFKKSDLWKEYFSNDQIVRLNDMFNILESHSKSILRSI